MTTRKLLIPGSLVMFAFLGCATGGVLVIDQANPRQAVAQDVDDGYFYENLAPHGQWFYQAEFGWVWHPTRVTSGWRPYTEGQWVWSDDAGWVWASNEPWGWATDHYGRWYFDPIYAWTWVPGRVWAPAWVNWRVENGYIGWAPMWPAYFDQYPDRRWDRWGHDHDWDRRHNGRDWDRWVFTRDRDFASDRVGRLAIRDRHERDRLYSRSRDVTRWDADRPERLSSGIDRRMIEKASGRPVRGVQLESVDRPGKRDARRPDQLQVFRPRIQERSGRTPDRLGLAKEPSRDARENDTIRREKDRLDRVPAKDKKPGRGGANSGGREVDNERGAAPQAIEPDRRGGGGGGRGDRPDSGARDGADDRGGPKGGSREPADAGKAKPDRENPRGDNTGRPDGQTGKPVDSKRDPNAYPASPRGDQDPAREEKAPRVKPQEPARGDRNRPDAGMEHPRQPKPERTQPERPQVQQQEPQREPKAKEPQRERTQPERQQAPQREQMQQPERQQPPQRERAQPERQQAPQREQLQQQEPQRERGKPERQPQPQREQMQQQAPRQERVQPDERQAPQQREQTQPAPSKKKGQPEDPNDPQGQPAPQDPNDPNAPRHGRGQH